MERSGTMTCLQVCLDRKMAGKVDNFSCYSLDGKHSLSQLVLVNQLYWAIMESLTTFKHMFGVWEVVLHENLLSLVKFENILFSNGVADTKSVACLDIMASS